MRKILFFLKGNYFESVQHETKNIYLKKYNKEKGTPNTQPVDTGAKQISWKCYFSSKRVINVKIKQIPFFKIWR